MTARNIRLIVTASAACALAACQTTTSAPPAEAMLTESSAATTQMLSKAVSKALGGVDVKLANNVLMDSPTLTLETRIPQSMDGGRMVGAMNDRARPAPDRFTLMKEGRSCYLVHENTGQKLPLGSMKCQVP